MDSRLLELNSAVEREPLNIDFLLERAKYLYKIGERALAYNDFVTILSLNPEHVEAKGYLALISGILNYEYREPLNV